MSPEDRQKYIALTREKIPQLCADFDQGFCSAFETISDCWARYHDDEDVNPQDAENIYFDLYQALEQHCDDFAYDGVQVIELLRAGDSEEEVQSAIDEALSAKEGETRELLYIVLTAAMEQADNYEMEVDFADEFAELLQQAIAGDQNYKRIKEDYVETLSGL